MARATFVKSARKDNPDHGIKKGDSYWWWSFRTAYSSSKHYSKTRPRPSQLTQSEYTSTFLGIQEGVEDAANDIGDIEDLKSSLEDAKSSMEDLQSECEDKLSNLESAFPGGSPTIDLIQERVDNCQSTIDSIESAVSELENLEDSDEEDPTMLEDGDHVIYREQPGEVCASGIKDPTTGGTAVDIALEDGTVIRVVPSMTKDGELKKVNDNWRDQAADIVNNIEWAE